MSKQTSLDAAVTALAYTKSDRFWLSCPCGWETAERRDWVKYRIERHFSFPDATDDEHVSTAEWTQAITEAAR